MDTTLTRANAVALGLAFALAALLLVWPGKSAAAHEDCTLSAGAPVSYLGTAVIVSGSVDCATAKNVIRIYTVLTRDGAVVANGERMCHKAATCPTYLFVDDPPENQAYCFTASARVGPHALAAVTRCEADESP